MSLEVAIQENTKAVRDLIATLNRAPNSPTAPTKTVGGGTGAPIVGADQVARPAATNAKPAPATPPAKPATPPSTPAALNYMKDVQPTALKLVGAEGGRAKMVEILTKYGVKLGAELKPEQLAGFLADVKAAIAELAAKA